MEGNVANIWGLIIIMAIAAIVIIWYGAIINAIFVYPIACLYKKRYENKVEQIKNDYPHAYEKYISDNNISRLDAKLLQLRKIAKRSTDLWFKEEEDLKQQEVYKKEIESTFYEIVDLYPDGFEKWKAINNRWTKEKAVSNRYKIKDLDKLVKEAKEFDKWEAEQREFTKKCRNLVDTMLPDFGCYDYQVPFKKINDEGKSINGNYKVWQSFHSAYCLATYLDYTDFEYIKKNTSNLDKFKNRSRYYLSSVYEDIRHFIEQLSNDYPISVYLCANNQSWSAESLHYHYCECDGAPFYDLPDNVEVCDPVTDALLEGTEIDYDNYPILKNRHIVIVEMQTDNEHLKEVCKNIIEKNRDKKPLITYISFKKGYDSDEMLKLIVDERKKKKEEEERIRKEREEEEKRRKEREKYKPEREEIIKLLEDNNIHCFYHFTALDNLDLIRQHGGLYSWWSLQHNIIEVPFLGGEGFGQR